MSGSEVDRTQQYEGSDSDQEDNELAPVTQKDNLSLATFIRADTNVRSCLMLVKGKSNSAF